MAVDLGDLIDSLKYEVTPPGSTPVGTDDEYLGHLQNAFWTARLRGALVSWTEADGSITPVTGTTDMPREFQQLIVLAAAINIVRSAMRNANTVFRSKAGPVEFETQQSAQTLRELLVQINSDYQEALNLVVTQGYHLDHYFDAVIERSWAFYEGSGFYVGG